MTRNDSPVITRNRQFNPDGSGRFTVKPASEPPKPTRGQTIVEYGLFAIAALLVSLSVMALYTAYSPAHKVVPNHVAEGLREDRVNILLFGVGGERHPKHDDLADAILLVSLKPSTRQAAVVSIPRDLWVHMNGYGTHRINYAHEIGDEGGYPGAGPGLLCDTVSSVFAQPVHAYVRVDFSAFEQLIDEVGGVDVYCQRSFYDQLFHDGFNRGWLHLNGKRALAYARYRYIIGPEGDNYARELRQQQVIAAFCEKLQHLGAGQTMAIVQTVSTLSEGTRTNLTTAQLLTLYRTFHDVKLTDVRHVSLKPLTEPFDVMRLGDPGEAVRTRSGNFDDLRRIEATVFNGGGQISTDDQIRFATFVTR